MANIQGDSPEAVAFALLEQIVYAENKVQDNKAGSKSWSLTPEEILDRFAQCLAAAKGHGWRSVRPASTP